MRQLGVQENLFGKRGYRRWEKIAFSWKSTRATQFLLVRDWCHEHQDYPVLALAGPKRGLWGIVTLTPFTYPRARG